MEVMGLIYPLPCRPDTFVARLIGGDETLDRPGRAADEEPVDVRERGEGCRVARVDAAAIQNRDVAAGLPEQVLRTRT